MLGMAWSVKLSTPGGGASLAVRRTEQVVGMAYVV